MKKRILSAVFGLLLVPTVVLSGCGQKDEGKDEGRPKSTEVATDQATPTEAPRVEDGELPFVGDLNLTFASGVGAWSTDVVLQNDGSFSGMYSDWNPATEDYLPPRGELYICEFTGKFTDIEKLNDYSYQMTIGDMVLENPIGEEWIEDDMLYIATEPYGLDGGEQFILYTPDTPLTELSEDLLAEWQHYMVEETIPGKISCFLLKNQEAGHVFVNDWWE